MTIVTWHYKLADEFGIPRHGVPFSALEHPLAEAMKDSGRSYYTEYNQFLSSKAEMIKAGKVYKKKLELHPIPRQKALKLGIELNDKLGFTVDLTAKTSQVIKEIKEQFPNIPEISPTRLSEASLRALLVLGHPEERKLIQSLKKLGVITLKRGKLEKLINAMNISSNNLEVMEKEIHKLGNKVGNKYQIY